MPKIVYGVMGVLVVAVVVLTGLVGYLYGQGSQTATVTTTVTSQTTTATTTTQTHIITVTNTSGNFTRFEKLEITSAFSTAANKIVLNVKNTGSSDATITDVFVNGIPIGSFSPTGSITANPIENYPSLRTGDEVTLTLTFAANLSHGVTYDIKVHTASGTDYPKAVVVP